MDERCCWGNENGRRTFPTLACGVTFLQALIGWKAQANAYLLINLVERYEDTYDCLHIMV